jgi:hypothetical protein
MNRLIFALATSTVLIACSNSEDVAGGVTDIGNKVAQETDSIRIHGTVVNMQGKIMPAAKLSLYWDNGIAVVDSSETVADSKGQFELKLSHKPIIADSTQGGIEEISGFYLFAESDSLSGITLASESKDTEIRIGSHKVARGSIAGATSGIVRIGGTNLVAEVKEDGSFSFDSIPPGMHAELIYSESDNLLGHISFSIQDKGDTLVLPQLENYNGFLWNPDLALLSDVYGFTFSHTDQVLNTDTGWTAVTIEMNGNEDVFNHDGKLADNVNYIEGVGGKAIMLEMGQYIDLDTLNPTDGDFTLSLWAKWNGPNGEHQVLFCQRAYWSDSTSRFQWHYEMNSGTFAVMKSMPGVPEAVYFGDSTSIPVGEWVFLTLVSRNHLVSMYVNGEPVPIAGTDGTEFAREFVPNNLNRSVPFRIGGNEIETETWNGAIGRVTIETRARSSEWIKALYSSFSPI